MKSSQKLHDEIKQLCEKGLFEQALKIAKQELINYQNNSVFLHQYGSILVLQGKFKEATSFLENAVKLKPNEALYHSDLAVCYTNLTMYDEAIEHLEIAAQLEPDNVYIYHYFASIYFKLLLLNEAKKYWLLALKINESYQPSLYYLAQLYFRENNYCEAKKLLNKLIAINPENYLGLKLLGHIYFLEENFDDALKFYEETYHYCHDDIDLLNNMGATLIKLKQDEKAIYYFIKAVSLNNGHYESLNNLASLYLKQDRYEIAARHYENLLENYSDDIEAHYNLAVCYMTSGDLDKALNHFDKITIDDKNFYCDSLVNIAIIYIKKKNYFQAREYLEKILSVYPDTLQATFLLDVISDSPKSKAIPEQFTKNLFDNYAVYYEKHMVEVLKYRLHEIILHFIQQMKKEDLKLTSFDILDLGCGTGLVAQQLKPYARKLIGVDISEKMIHYASKKNIYNSLIQEDLIYYLANNSNCFDMIIAADVFNYFGELINIFKHIKNHLTQNGIFIFSIELLEEASSHYLISKHIRFRHSEAYILDLIKASGLSLIDKQKIIPRYQDNQPVEALIFCLKKAELTTNAEIKDEAG